MTDSDKRQVYIAAKAARADTERHYNEALSVYARAEIDRELARRALSDSARACEAAEQTYDAARLLHADAEYAYIVAERACRDAGLATADSAGD
jgi:hypothetical protein